MGNGDGVHPTKKSCFLSSIFFCWTLPVFFRSLKQPFNVKDLFPPLSEHESSRLGDKLETAWNLQLTKQNPSLWKCFFKVFAWDFFKIGVIVAFNEFVIKLSQPVSMWKLIQIHNPHENIVEKEQAYIYALFLIIASFANTIFFQYAIFSLTHLGAKVKVACGSLIYRKSLKLSKNTQKLPTNGQIVNLLSNDLNRFDKFFLPLHYLWLAPIQSAIVLYLLYTLLDLSAIMGIGFYFVFIPLHLFLARKNSYFRERNAIKTDERVRLIDEIISAIHVIKMYTWENLFVKLTNNIRKEEVYYTRASLCLRAFQNSFNKHINTGAVFICILVYVLSGNRIKSEYVFVIKTFYFLLKNSMTNLFPEALKNIDEAKVSVRRIEKFLMKTEVEHTVKCNKMRDPGICLKYISAKWLSSGFELNEIDFKATSKDLVALVGPTGSGKTSLVKVMLQEMTPTDGYIRMSGKVSYAPQEPYLVSGTIKQNILFGQALNENRYKEVVRVCALEHDLQSLPYGDGSVVGNRGTSLSGGQKARINLARAVYQDADIYLLDDPLSALDVSVGRQIFNECFVRFLRDKCVVLVTHQLQYLQKVDNIYLLKNGHVFAQGSYENLRNCGYFSNCGEDLEHKEGEFETKSEPFSVKIKEQVPIEEENVSGTIAWKIYFQYFLLGGCCQFFGLIFFLIVTQFLQSGSEFFEAEWINLQKEENEQHEQSNMMKNLSKWIPIDYCIYIYGAFMILILLFTITTTIWFSTYFTKVAIKLHNKMFSSIINAKMNFFYNNPTGSILNRFSKDMGTLDTNIPKLLLDTIQIGLNAVAVACVIGIVNPWLVFASVILFCEFYILRSFYLRTGRELKRIEAESRSPIFSHLSESLHGLETIRAFNVEHAQKQKFDRLQNRSISALHTYYSCSTAFSIWLDLSCCCYISIVTYSCFWGEGTFGANLGLIITQAMSLANLLQYGMKQWCEFENEMISVERIVQYSDIEPEEEMSEDALDSDNKMKLLCGDIEFDSLFLSYKNNAQPILKNITLHIVANQKIGIVGRTGAGKSSIIAALFRLAQLGGKITIGGVDITQLPMKTVRSQISIIPQEPVLFTGTVRDNLDPFNSIDDDHLWKLLEELELKEVVKNFPAGLDSRIMEKGSNLSVGQRQLFCLARALLRKNNILVLDEATANVDIKTDSLIQTTIKKRLNNSTVLIIAHRLNTVMDCDNVLVLDGGEVMEFDHPHILLQNENSLFFSLVSKTGHSMTEHLKQIALKNYASQK